MKINYREKHAFEDDNQPPDFRGLDLCVCGLPEDSHYHTPLLKEETPPSAQTEWNKGEYYFDFKTIEDRKRWQEWQKIHDSLLIEDFKTRLLSVESMKMEERELNPNGRDLQIAINNREKESRNALRQSILSEVEKGSV